MPKKNKLLSQSNPDVNILGRITIEVFRDDSGPWVYAVEDDGEVLESFTDLGEAVDYVRRTIEDSARAAARCERIGKTCHTLREKPRQPTLPHLTLAKR